MKKKAVRTKWRNSDEVQGTKAVLNHVSRVIHRHRHQLGITQEQLCAKCQVRGANPTRSTLAKIEAGLRSVKACELFVIARVMGVPIENFFPVDFGVPPRPHRRLPPKP
ncbi:MAG: helix-turn-helix transcriptional regulator [Verrucomicrobia bacterium]|nr:helix-turn-helix transcriptional regulator [Verrucomicrobiota bacterium]